ncbi:MAG: GTPase ObgE [Candidatus Atribacteria bacterium]|nr:GTPase ObgE [Candidatus Atribacteria bacterium]
MFSDQVIIWIKAGDGGNGAVSFRRERFVPKGGPDGGDGGKGGDVFLKADKHINTLVQFYKHPHCKADNGENGSGTKKNGKTGSDLILKVPVGTVVEDLNSHQLLADLSEAGKEIRVARGGSGGKGNYRFRSSSNQAPRFAQKGEVGEEKKLKLILKLIADVGLVGFPNVGKSTLLSRVSAARPKIADYPFTTLEPNLGVVQVDEDHSFVMADIPGLIEGAHHGLGLGTRFLKHIERTKVIVHILDGSLLNPEDLYQNYQIIENELAKYSLELGKKDRIITINKCDLPEIETKVKQINEYFSGKGFLVHFISAIRGDGLKELIYKIHQMIEEFDRKKEEIILEKESDEQIEKPVHYQHLPEFVIRREGDTFIIEGEKIRKLAYQYDLTNRQALEFFQKKIKGLGVEKALRKKGIIDGNKVKIGDKDFYFYS